MAGLGWDPADRRVPGRANGWSRWTTCAVTSATPSTTGSSKRGCVTCPWHGWRYDLRTGEHLTLFGRRAGLRRYPVRTEGDDVLIDVDYRSSMVRRVRAGRGCPQRHRSVREAEPAMRMLWKIVKTIFGSLFLAIVVFVGAPAAFGVTVLAGLIFLPLPATIPIPKPNPSILPTVIYDRYGHQIATLQQYDRNVPVTEAEIPEVLKEAVIADEDRNFYHHGGVDFRGTLRALYDDVRHKGPLQGGSTITQQYVKLAFTNQQRTLVRKVREAILASQLTREASKNEILYRYLTLVYFGDGNYGIGAAAENYFHVPASHLNASQAATLAGLIPAPSARAPRENLAAAETARELVLKEMQQQGYLSPAQYQAALAQRLALDDGHRIPPGATVVYENSAPSTAYPDFVDYVTRWLLAHFPSSEVYGGGLRVQTTLDPTVQADAYAAVRSTLAGTSPPSTWRWPWSSRAPASCRPWSAGGASDRPPGQPGPRRVRPSARGPRHRGGGRNLLVEARASPGAATGVSRARPGSRSPSPPPSSRGSSRARPTRPRVSTRSPAARCRRASRRAPARSTTTNLAASSAPRRCAQATVESTNTVYAQVAAQVGCNNVATTAKKLGIESAYYSTPPFFYCQSYALGELDVSPLDMASAYGVFADHGQRATPTPILEIVNGAGKVLVNNISPLPATTTGAAGQRGRQRHQGAAGRHLRRHRDRRPAGPSGRR